MVGEGVVHGLSVVRCGKDSEKSRWGVQVMQIFCHAVFGHGLVKLGEVKKGGKQDSSLSNHRRAKAEAINSPIEATK